MDWFYSGVFCTPINQSTSVLTIRKGVTYMDSWGSHNAFTNMPLFSAPFQMVI